MSSPLDIHIDDSTGSAENANENGDPAVLIPPCLGSAAQERSPFDDLPTELTENILTLVVWAYDQRDFKLVETRTKYDIRTRLSLVCNSWKEVIRGVRHRSFLPSSPESRVNSQAQGVQIRADIFLE